MFSVGSGRVLAAGCRTALMVVALGWAGCAMADDDFDRIIGMLNHAVPDVFAAPAPVTLAPTGIECVALPCPYWKVESADGSLLIGVERVVDAADDDGVELENAIWAYLRAHDYAPLAVEGYVIDRERSLGQPPIQRVLVVTTGPLGAP